MQLNALLYLQINVVCKGGNALLYVGCMGDGYLSSQWSLLGWGLKMDLSEMCVWGG